MDESGHRHVVGNGRLPARTIITGIGPVEVSQRRLGRSCYVLDVHGGQQDLAGT